MKQKGILVVSFLIFFLVCESGFSKTTNAIVNGGNWTTAGTWDNGVPASGDVINIPPGITVVVNSGLGSPINLRGGGVTTINVSGILSLAAASIIQINSGDGDVVNILSGGSILDGGGGGSIAFGTIITLYFPLVFINNLFGFPTAGPINGPATIQNGTLPVELISFTAKLVNDQVEFRWATASERNNDFFAIERASNIERFETIGNPIKGKGTTTETSNYQAVDENPLYGRTYYRLKQTDFDGQFTYSDLVVVDYDGPRFSNLSVFPNPTMGHNIMIKVVGLKDQATVPVQIYNTQGQKVYDQVVEVTTPGTLEKELAFESQLPQGLYIIRAGQTLQLTRKIIVD